MSEESVVTIPRGLIVDSNVLLRLASPADVHHPVAVKAVNDLLSGSTTLYATPQTFYEFWAVVTRPVTARSGLGWSPTQAAAEVAQFEKVFPLLEDTADVYQQWCRLVSRYSVSGMNSHDARYVAVFSVYRNSHSLGGILTFNVADFARYTTPSPQGEGVMIVDPITVAPNQTS